MTKKETTARVRREGMLRDGSSSAIKDDFLGYGGDEDCKGSFFARKEIEATSSQELKALRVYNSSEAMCCGPLVGRRERRVEQEAEGACEIAWSLDAIRVSGEWR